MSAQNSPGVDHVLIGVPDLDAAATRLDDDYGLSASGGGRHPGWGTANRIVPFGNTYLELVTVVDTDEAAGSAFGRWVARMIAGTTPPTGWVARTDDIGAIANRLGLEVDRGSRRSATGDLLQWSLAGVAAASERPGIPFFIEWSPGTPHPGSASVEHGAGSVTLQQLRVECDRAQLREWLGTDDLPVHVTPGTGGLTAVVLDTTDGEVVIDLGRLSTPPPTRPPGW